jgi:hypothetical protein
MKIVFVAMPESLHTVRWIIQLLDQGWQIFLFPTSFYGEPHKALQPYIDRRYPWARWFGASIRPGKIHYCVPFDFGLRVPHSGRRIGNLFMSLLSQFCPGIQDWHFRRIVKKTRPDLVHSMEFQHAGKAVLTAKKRLTRFPPWLATIWGSDIFLFGRLPWEKPLVQEIVGNCDFFSSECERDVQLVKKLGFKGKIWPPMPLGGFDLEAAQRIRNRYASEPRRYIMIKGYSDWSGRSIFAISALKRCRDLLKGYKVILFSWAEEARVAMELASQECGFEYEALPHGTPLETLLALHAQSRVYLGAGISDGISVSSLEAMMMGSFPMQANGSCCAEWFKDGESGLSFHAEDIDAMAVALRRVLTDDELCRRAREMNDETVKTRLDAEKIKQDVVRLYRELKA